MLPVLAEQPFQAVDPVRRPQVTVHRDLVERDHGPFRRDDRLQRDHVG